MHVPVGWEVGETVPQVANDDVFTGREVAKNSTRSLLLLVAAHVESACSHSAKLFSEEDVRERESAAESAPSHETAAPSAMRVICASSS